MTSADLRAAVDRVLPSVRADLEALVRIPSISADPSRVADVRTSAERVAELARGAGAADAEVVSVDGGAPAVIAHWPAPEGAPTVLLYAHHDVQPTGDVEQWTSPPFEPTERGARLYGRGTADDKAGIAIHLAALRAFDGAPPVGVIWFIEGEEEIGSPTFRQFLTSYRDRLAADVIVVADSATWTVDVPALTTSLRGLVDCTVEVRTLQAPVHSGLFGGPVLDALTSLVRLLATLHDDKGDVAVPGLVDSAAAPIDYTEERFRAEAGVVDGVELSGTGSIADRLWTKPSLTVLAIDSPPVDDVANVLQPVARAKVSMRLAPGQDAAAAMAALTRHLEDHAPFGAQVSVQAGALGSPSELTTTSPAFRAAAEAHTEAYGANTVQIGIGGSIPFIADFNELFPDATVLATGAADQDAHAHGIDEGLHLSQFAKACLAEAMVLQRLADVS